MLIAVRDRDVIDSELRLIAACARFEVGTAGQAPPSGWLTNCWTNATS
jgi:hypothetical protein